MAGPWDKYTSAQTDDSGDQGAAGPWAKYSAQPAAPSTFAGSAKSMIDSLPMLGGVTGGILGTPADAFTGPAGTIGGAAIGGYLGTAAKNLINRYYDPASAPQTTTQALTQPVVGGIEQGLMQGVGEGISAAGAGLPAIVNSADKFGEATKPYITRGIESVANAGSGAAKWAGSKLMSSLGGVSPDVIKEYALNASRINAAPSVDALKEVSDNVVGKLASDVEAKNLTTDQAQAAYDGLKSDLKDSYRTASYDARDAVNSAQQTLKDAHSSNIQQVASDVYDTVGQLKDDVQAGSAKALETLEKSKAQIDLNPVYSKIDDTIAGLKKAGTDESLQVADKLENYKQRLQQNNNQTQQIGYQPSGKLETLAPAVYEKSTPEGLAPARFIFGSSEDQWIKNGLLGKEVTPRVEFQPIGPKWGATSRVDAPDAKALIQGLDKITEYSPMAGTFDKAKNAAFKGIRSTLDQTLKQSVPEYAKAMEPVASDASLLSRVQPFGDKQAAAGMLQRISAPNQMENAAALKELGSKYDTDFIHAANPARLPEYTALNKAYDAQQALRPDLVSEKIEQTLAASRKKAGLSAAQSGLSEAEQKLAPFKSLAPNSAGQTQAQQKLLQLGKGNNIELTDMFDRLGKLSDTDFVQAMKDNSIKAAFQKGAMNGSRNTLIGGIIGWMFGGVGGAAVGASAGRVADQWGPAITKKALDGALQIAKNPSIEAISNLSLPDPIKQKMIVGLQNYMAAGAKTAESAIPAAASNQNQGNPVASKGPNGWALQGAKTLGLDSQTAAKVLADPAGRQLLMQASDFSAGSKGAKNIMSQIQKRWANG